MEIKISIIITVYNVSKYLDACIESVANQTYKNLEIILVDDGSVDDSGEKCEKWGKKDSRIRVIHKKNGGAVSARKLGVNAATGYYIGFVDGDDWIEKNMYEQMVHIGFQENVDIISVEDIREYEDGRNQVEKILLPEGVYKDDAFLNGILPNIINIKEFFQWNIPMHGWQHLFKSNILKKNQGMIDEHVKRGEDMLTALSCYIGAESAALLKQPLYHYRQVTSSARSTVTRQNLEGLMHLNNRLLEISDNNNRQHKVVEEEIRSCILYTLLWAAYEICLTEKDTELFPYQVPKNAKIALVGAGAFGVRLYKRIKELEFCEIKVWVDNGWENYQRRNLSVQSLEKLREVDFDYAVIAVLNAEVREQLINDIKKQGISDDKVQMVKREIVFNDKLHVFMDRLLYAYDIDGRHKKNDK